MAAKHDDGNARERLLRAALKHFAECGYAGASVQDIVVEAGVTKPTLYYYFTHKAGLYNALIDLAQDERLRLMQTAAARGRTLPEKLTEVVSAQFAFVSHNRDLTRLAYVTLFASAREVPDWRRCLARNQRNFEFVRQLIRAARAAGEVDRQQDSEVLAMGIYGMMVFHIMRHLAVPDHQLTAVLAARLVRLFLKGATARSRPGPAPSKKTRG